MSDQDRTPSMDDVFYRLGYEQGWAQFKLDRPDIQDLKSPMFQNKMFMLGWEDGKGDRTRKYSIDKNVTLKDEQKSLAIWASLRSARAAERDYNKMLVAKKNKG